MRTICNNDERGAATCRMRRRAVDDSHARNLASTNGAHYKVAMSVIDIMIVVAIAAVVIALGLGLYTLYRGGEGARLRAGALMRWRVGLQAVAIGLILVGLAIKKAHGA